MRKVLLIQPILSHYRETLFNLLTLDPNIDFNIIAGNDFNNVKTFNAKSSKITIPLKNHFISLKGHKFYYQQGIFKELKRIKPTNVILGGPDFHFISTVLLSFYIVFFTKIKIHFWTHGVSKSQSPIIYFLTKFLFNKATSILTYEEEGKEDVIKTFKLNKDKIFVVKNCLNNQDYGFNKDTNFIVNKESNLFNVLFSGRITKAKRLDLLINATKILKDKGISMGLVIIGDGVDLKYFKDNVKKENLDDFIKFKGAIYGQDVDKYFFNSDVFVLPGKVGLSIVHALSYGLPVVTTSLPIHSPEVAILKNNKNAFFYKEQNAHVLAEALLSAMAFISNNKDIKKDCINSVIESGYLPEIMKENIIYGINS